MVALNTPVGNLRMIGPVYVAKLKKLGIETIGDLLYHIPNRYDNYSLISKINLLQVGEKVTVIGKVKSFANVYTRRGKKIQKAKIADETGEIDIVWYNQPFLAKLLSIGTTVTIAGEVHLFGHQPVFESPEFEIIKQTSNNTGQTINLIHTGRLVPIYPETAGISSKWLRSRIAAVLYKLSPQIIEFMPKTVAQQFNLYSQQQAIYNSHFPKTEKQAKLARFRLSFDELLILQLSAAIRRKMWQEKIVTYKFQISPFKLQIAKFLDGLPFQLTGAQKKSVGEILTDLSHVRPMNRLLEGDVGSGKTVVAAIAMYISFLNGFQSAIMAPTEILATQHYETIKTLLKPCGTKVELVTGKIKPKSKAVDIFVGTHALLSDKLFFPKLGLVVIDEQQRFGVEQRGSLRQKGKNPHLLSMTATPIPRTIALSIYADLDLSILDEMPYGRKLVKTWVVAGEKRQAAYDWIKKQILSTTPRQQAFIICPLIEESESLVSVKAVKVEYEKLKKEIFPDLRLGLLHGKLKPGEKSLVLDDFKNNKLHILVATAVVEVGIDIPQATIMLIEAADRFGLAQLHQLRGRVGRRLQQSYCLLFSEVDNAKTIKRLKLLEENFNGPKLAELDLQLRGGGELFGTKQHGQLGFKIADITDTHLLQESKKAAKFLFSQDPALSSFPLLKERVKKYTINKVVPD